MSDAAILIGAPVYTGMRPTPAAAVRIEAGRIAKLYATTAQARADRRGAMLWELAGGAVLPGLVDAHFHLHYLGTVASELDLTATRSRAEVLDALAAAVAERPPGSWIKGRGWDETRWPDGQPELAALDAVAPEHPVWIERVDGHAGWTNSQGLRAAGVDASSQSPAGGEIKRDAAGRLTGVLVDRAMELLRSRLPQPSAAQIRAQLRAGMQRCARAGLTTVHDMGIEPHVLPVLSEMAAAGELDTRVVGYVYGTPGGPLPDVGPGPGGTGLLRVVGVKLFVDGALGSRGAALFSPYHDQQDSRGLVMTDPEALAATARAAHRAGHQIAIHAIGDRGNSIALDAIGAAQQQQRPRFWRHRIEHAQVVTPADLARFRALGCIASIQPVHLRSDMHWLQARLGPARGARAFAWRDFLEAGVPLALGSDAPVESENPWHGIHVAVTRQTPSGEPAGGWARHHALGLGEALAGFGRWAHAAVGMHGGRIAPGLPADLTVVDRDPWQQPPEALHSVQTLATFVAGRAVYAAG